MHGLRWTNHTSSHPLPKPINATSTATCSSITDLNGELYSMPTWLDSRFPRVENELSKSNITSKHNTQFADVCGISSAALADRKFPQFCFSPPWLMIVTHTSPKKVAYCELFFFFFFWQLFLHLPQKSS